MGLIRPLLRIFPILNYIYLIYETLYQTIYNTYKQLVGAKLELNNNYQIDNDKVLTIVGIDNDDDEKPFKVSVRGKGGESNYGNIGFDALKNLLYNKSLFENKKGQR